MDCQALRVLSHLKKSTQRFRTFPMVLSKNSKHCTRGPNKNTDNCHARQEMRKGTELLVASTAMRACLNRHLRTLTRCCGAVVANCFHPISCDNTDLTTLSHFVTSLTRGIMQKGTRQGTNYHSRRQKNRWPLSKSRS